MEIAVSGQGVGITPEDLPQLLKPYSRFYRHQKTKGTGLKLLISQGIIWAHSGHIHVESRPGRGTNSHPTIPRAGRSAP